MHVRIDEGDLSMDDLECSSSATCSAMAASYNDQIRPLLDAVDRLRQLKVTQEGIQLPTIVVVGDQSSGKSSVLESLAGISLPRGQGICTRVPLIMRLQDDPAVQDASVRQLEYSSGMVVPTSEAQVADAINAATAEIAGGGKGISDAPITLVVRKRGVPDLTLVDLPGITRVAVQGQPEDIYDQVARMIKAYIAPKESIILNVLSAQVDFPTCESIRMSQQVDRTGERTLAVVTKADRAPEGLLEKVTMDDVHIGLGYVCVRNRVGEEETYEEAREQERRLFAEHPLLSKIDKSMVGIPTLARRLTEIQGAIIARCLPDIVREINDRLGRSMDELGQMPPDLSNVADAARAFFHIVKQVCASLEKLLLRGEFDEYPDDASFHGTARVAEMLATYGREMPALPQRPAAQLFLVEEMRVLEESRGITLPNFLPRSALQVLLKKKVESIVHVPHGLVKQVWEYVGDLVMRILLRHSHDYPQVQSSCRHAVQSLMDKARQRSAQHVEELIEMELAADYTANPEYMRTCGSIMQEQDMFLKAMEDAGSSESTQLQLRFGEVDVSHLKLDDAELAGQAFDLKARLAAYWNIVLLRLVDGLALHVLLSIRRLVEKHLAEELTGEVLGKDMAGAKRMLVPPPGTAAKRDRLRNTIAVLRESREVVANIMDRSSALG
jgi:GTP-binding protein EngB required for normal cell division